MKSIPIGQAVLQKVVAKLGGIQTASVKLGVSPAMISRFLYGTVYVPDVILLRAIDLVLDDDFPAILSQSQPFNRTSLYR